MAGLLEHVMINKLGDDLDEAITLVGGNTSGVTNIMQYPLIIKDQLTAGDAPAIPKKELILEGDTCIIKSDENGYDIYNTQYASGTKTGLNPNTLYIRICTAVKGIEPIYIDTTPLSEIIGDIDMENIINEVIGSIPFTDEGVDANELNW